MKIPGQQRKAISPIVATVLIIAATLIAAAAILGYVFGIFGSSSNTANISVTSASFPHNAASGNTASITLTNAGSGSASSTSVFLSYGGTSCTLAAGIVTGTGALAGGASQTITITPGTAGQYCGAIAAGAGNAYNGYVSLSNGAEASFTGTLT